MTPVLELRRVSRQVGGKVLVRDVSLGLAPGEVTVLVGPNGAGKSSLVGLASGLRQPEHGLVTYDGRAVTTWRAADLAAKRAVMAQAVPMPFAFPVVDVVRIACDGIGRSLRDRVIAEALDRGDVAHLADRIYPTLSGGEQQRVRFARALAQLAAGATVARDQILILDEPVASLDLKHQIQLMDNVRAIAASGVAVLVVLHDLALARAYADRLVVMADGGVVATGRPSAILTHDLVRSVFEVDPAAAHGVLDWLKTPAATAGQVPSVL